MENFTRFLGINKSGTLKVLLVVVGMVWGVGAWGATYYSKSGVAPNLTTSWNTNRDGTSGTAPANFTSGDIFVVQGSVSAPGGAAHSIITSANIFPTKLFKNFNKAVVPGGLFTAHICHVSSKLIWKTHF